MLCEYAKRSLSKDDEIEIDYSLFEDYEIDSSLAAAKMDYINSELYNQTIEFMMDVLVESGLSKNQIDDIILVGGSSKIKKIQNKVKKIFGKELYKWKDYYSDEVVAIGAGLLAEDIYREKMYFCDINDEYRSDNQNRGKKVIVEGELSHSIGIEGNNGEMIIILQKGTIYGKEIIRDGFTPLNDYDMLMRWNIYEGESEKAKECNLLFSYEMENLPSKRRSDYNFEVKMCVNGNNMLDVEITEKHRFVERIHFVIKI